MEKIQASPPEEIRMGDLLYLYLDSSGWETIKKADKENLPNYYAAEDLKGRSVYLNRKNGTVYSADERT